jgi:hypothetical protein
MTSYQPATSRVRGAGEASSDGDGVTEYQTFEVAGQYLVGIDPGERPCYRWPSVGEKSGWWRFQSR